MSYSFAEKIALVTGAASGMGYALCKELQRRGACVYAADIDAEALRRLCAAETSGRAIIPVTLDVSNREDFERTVAALVAAHHRIDYMFNNAGIVTGGDTNDMTPALWEKIMAVNLWGVIYGTSIAYRYMRAQKSGHIINVASSAGILPVPYSTAYATTKHGVVGLSVSLREEARPHGIKVSVVIPGVVDTAIFQKATNIKNYNYSARMQKIHMSRVPPDRAAAIILSGARRNKQMIIFPLVNRLIILLFRLAPRLSAWLIGKTV